jgi:hypothetical protein
VATQSVTRASCLWVVGTPDPVETQQVEGRKLAVTVTVTSLEEEEEEEICMLNIRMSRTPPVEGSPVP